MSYTKRIFFFCDSYKTKWMFSIELQNYIEYNNSHSVYLYLNTVTLIYYSLISLVQLCTCTYMYTHVCILIIYVHDCILLFSVVVYQHVWRTNNLNKIELNLVKILCCTIFIIFSEVCAGHPSSWMSLLVGVKTKRYSLNLFLIFAGKYQAIKLC